MCVNVAIVKKKEALDLEGREGLKRESKLEKTEETNNVTVF